MVEECLLNNNVWFHKVAKYGLISPCSEAGLTSMEHGWHGHSAATSPLGRYFQEPFAGNPPGADWARSESGGARCVPQLCQEHPRQHPPAEEPDLPQPQVSLGLFAGYQSLQSQPDVPVWVDRFPLWSSCHQCVSPDRGVPFTTDVAFLWLLSYLREL